MKNRERRKNMGKRKKDTENYLYYVEGDSEESGSDEMVAYYRQQKSVEKDTRRNKTRASEGIVERMRQQMYKDAGISSSSSDESDELALSDSETTSLTKKRRIQSSGGSGTETEEEDEQGETTEDVKVDDRAKQALLVSSSNLLPSIPATDNIVYDFDEEEDIFEDGDAAKSAVLDKKWEKKYQELIAFVKTHNHFIVGKGPLEGWVHRQRVEHRQGKLHPLRSKKLEEISFPWNPKDDKWNQKFEELKKAHTTNEVYGPSSLLAKWEIKQKQLRQTGKLISWKIEKLNSIKFDWTLNPLSALPSPLETLSYVARGVGTDPTQQPLLLSQVNQQPLQLSNFSMAEPLAIIQNPHILTVNTTNL